MRLRRMQHVAFRQVGDETILLNLRTNRMYALNETGGYLWHVLESADAIEGVARALGDGESGRETGADALRAFLDSMVDEGLSREAKQGDEVSEPIVAPEFPREIGPPEILWSETLQVVGQSCAFLPGQSFTCDQAPGQ